jgi:chemotaxis protein CheC
MKDLELARWTDLVSRSTRASMANLTAMIGQDVSVTSFSLREAQLAEVANLLGGPETITVGIYLTVSGSADGHIMLMYDPKIALAFVDLMLMQPVGTTTSLGDLEQSALGEMGNVVGTSFLNVVADSAKLRLFPSPPSVITDMAGALLDVIAADVLLLQDDAMVAETSFRAGSEEMSGQFFVIPGSSLMEALRPSLMAA